MTEQVCAYEKCSETFTPKRPHQRFHHESCRYAQWKLGKEREDASGGGQRVEGGVGTRGGNVRSVDEARDLQTASKALDRWRLVMELQIHRTLLETGHFHIDDLDCLDLPAEAFRVRGTLVSSVRRSGVMRSTNVYRKVSHKAANGRPAPIYEITPEGREELQTLVGSTSCTSLGHSGGAAGPSDENQGNVGVDVDHHGDGEGAVTGIDAPAVGVDPGDPGPIPAGGVAGVGTHPSSDTKCEAVPSPPNLAADLGSSPDSLIQLDEAKPKPRNAIFDDDWEDAA